MFDNDMKTTFGGPNGKVVKWDVFSRDLHVWDKLEEGDLLQECARRGVKIISLGITDLRKLAAGGIDYAKTLAKRFRKDYICSDE